MPTKPRRHRRTRDELAPAHTEAAAIAAARRIVRRRHAATPPDPHLNWLPPAIVDDEDLDAVYVHTLRPSTVAPDVRRAELADRAIVLAYLHQLAIERAERRLLAFLEHALDLHGAPSVYGPLLGLPTRQHCWNRRELLGRRYGLRDAADDTVRERQAHIAAWLAEHRDLLLDLATELVDHREILARLVDVLDRVDLLTAIDKAGLAMTSQPTGEFAGALSYALYLLRPDGPARPCPDPIVRDVLARAAVVHAQLVAALDPL
jgi:hypothetical protein